MKLTLLNFCTVVCFFVFPACSRPAIDMEQYHNQPQYTAEWKRIDSLARQASLPQTALKKTKELRRRAQKEKNRPQELTAIFRIIKYAAPLAENPLEEARTLITEELSQASFPETNILHAAFGDLYRAAYQRGGTDRTVRDADGEAPLLKWSKKRLVDSALSHYEKSLQHPTKLAQAPFALYKGFMTVQDSDSLIRPTLYDVLAHRCMDFYTEASPDITRPAERFTLNDPSWFANAELFIAKEISAADTLSFQYRTLRTIQDLMAYHKKENNTEALIHADLRRLMYLHAKSIHPQKDSLYHHALKSIRRTYPASKGAAEAAWRLARHLAESEYKPSAHASADSGRMDRRRAADLCKDVLRQDSTSFGARGCRAVLSTLQAPFFRMEVPEVISAQHSAAGRIEFTNIGKITLQVFPLSFAEYRQGAQPHSRNYAPSAHDSAVAEKSYTLPESTDLRRHSSEIALPPLGTGFYLLRLTARHNQKDTALFEAPLAVSQLSLIKGDAGQSFIICDRHTGKPRPRASLSAYTRRNTGNTHEYTLQETVSADDSGRVFLSTKGSAYLSVHAGEDTLPAGPGYLRGQTAPARTFSRDHLFTDRSIYRPGQEVFFKGIALHTHSEDAEQNRIRSNEKIHVTLRDFHNDRIDELNLTTDRFGAFHGSFILPAGGLKGRYTLRTQHGSRTISVEEYKRPRFKVTLEEPREAVTLKDSVYLHGTARALGGYPVQEGKVSYEITRRTRFPFRRRYWGGLPNRQSRVIARGTAVTNDTGGFTLPFQALPDPTTDPATDPVFDYTAKVSVTDMSGETRSAQEEISVGTRTLRLSHSLGSTVMITEEEVDLKVNAHNLQGSDLTLPVAVRIERIPDRERIIQPTRWHLPDTQLIAKEEFRRLFPHRPYGPEDTMLVRRAGAELLYEDSLTAGSAAEELSLHRWDPGSYRIILSAKDPGGRTIRDTSLARGIAPETDRPHAGDDLSLTPLTTEADPGDTAMLLVGTAFKDMHLTYGVIHNDTVLSEKDLILDAEQRLLKLPLTESMRGGVSLRISGVRNNCFYSEVAHVQIPYSNKDLHISLESFRRETEPGSAEEWRVKITGPKGAAADAQLAAVLYDGALDQLKPHGWSLSLFHEHSAANPRTGAAFAARDLRRHQNFSYRRVSSPRRQHTDLPQLIPSHHRYGFDDVGVRAYSESAAPAARMTANAMGSAPKKGRGFGGGSKKADSAHSAATPAKKTSIEKNPPEIRSDFAETAL
ncbi:MAG: MG2 domain-containing protein, partial [Fibrobacterota bacterium]